MTNVPLERDHFQKEVSSNPTQTIICQGVCYLSRGNDKEVRLIKKGIKEVIQEEISFAKKHEFV